MDCAWTGRSSYPCSFIGGGSYVSSKNQMVAKDQNVQAAFSEIDIDLQRRADLIPNLVATVKGYANVEETVLNNIAKRVPAS